jgi:hypothetical protein
MNVGELFGDFHTYRMENGLKTCEHKTSNKCILWIITRTLLVKIKHIS